MHVPLPREQIEEAKFELRSHHMVAHRKDSPSEKAHNVMYSSTQFTRSSTLAQIWLFSHFQQPTATPPPHKDLEYYLCVAANKGHSVCLELLLGAQVTATGNHTVLLRNVRSKDVALLEADAVPWSQTKSVAPVAELAYDAVCHSIPEAACSSQKIKRGPRDGLSGCPA